MVIYATEFVLWCGVFACGGYFNLIPWLRQKRKDKAMGRRAHQDHVDESDQAAAEGVSNDVALHQIPSSTSVFRTPSSVTSHRSSMRAVE